MYKTNAQLLAVLDKKFLAVYFGSESFFLEWARLMTKKKYRAKSLANYIRTVYNARLDLQNEIKKM